MIIINMVKTDSDGMGMDFCLLQTR